MKIRKNDEVKILIGKDQGKTGKVMRVLTKEGRAFIEGLNLSKRHLGKRGQTEGGVIDLAKSVNMSNLALICPSCKKTTRVGFKIEGEQKQRLCKKCGEVIK